MADTTQSFRTYFEENLDALGEQPEREAVVHAGRRISAGEFRDLIHRMARALRARGLGRGQTVSLLCGQLPETIAARYAANLIGCQVNHLYNELSVEVQAAMVRDIETRALIVDPRYAERAGELIARVPVEQVLVLGPAKIGDGAGPGAGSGAGPGEDLLELAAQRSAEPLRGLARPQDVCSIRHTGGTTGHPKAVYNTFEQMGSLRSQVQGVGAPGRRQLVCTALTHAASNLVDHALSGGGTVVLLDGFEPAAVLAAIERERITDLFLPPSLLYQLLDHPDIDRRDISSLRMLVYGGGQASPARVADAVRRFGPVLVQFYGQHEAGGIAVLGSADHDLDRPERLRAAGRVLPGVQVVILDEADCELPLGAVGEICVRSPIVMAGYWKQPELTAEVLRGGWLHTGDLGFLDAEGYLTIVDRLKDLINLPSGHVYTTEVEDVLNSHPEVLQSAVFGIRDSDWTEQVRAVVVPAPGSSVDERRLCAFVRAQRGAMYEPARITFLPELPLTEVGKPDKQLLRRAATAEEAGAQ